MNNYIFYLVILSVVLSFGFPYTTIETIFSYLTYAGVGVLLIEAIIKFFRNPVVIPKILKVWMWSIAAALIIFIIVPDYAKNSYLGDIREFTLPFGISFCTYLLYKDKPKLFKNFLIVLSVVTCISALNALMATGGFTIMQIYRYDLHKNQTSILFSQIGILLLFYFLFIKKKKLIFSITLLAAVIVCLTYDVVVRARTATLLFLFFSFYLLVKEYGKRILWAIPAILLIILFTNVDLIVDIFESSFYGNNGSLDNLDGLTSGRTSRMDYSFRYFLQSPAVGALSSYSENIKIWTNNYGIPHMYVLWKLVKYGVLGSLPFLVTYFYILIKSLKIIRHATMGTLLPACCLLMAIGFSLAEYSAPFGPGTAFVLCYMILGMALARNPKMI